MCQWVCDGLWYIHANNGVCECVRKNLSRDVLLSSYHSNRNRKTEMQNADSNKSGTFQRLTPESHLITRMKLEEVSTVELPATLVNFAPSNRRSWASLSILGLDRVRGFVGLFSWIFVID